MSRNCFWCGEICEMFETKMTFMEHKMVQINKDVSKLLINIKPIVQLVMVLLNEQKFLRSMKKQFFMLIVCMLW